ncbi:E3 ubiquitin-protein ligase SIRP1-like [Pyrus x bretschneideri]|uniref:E3 ubiquitin-protein ligase SIRP1-like n=1 Tax=Pyrus x bretschneideri TaxID=225117 RepID=UPI00202FE192|nr:E3 ubiquitin-protein ligase SIRP1-like [Pyrus x bretschneideri]
MDRQQREYRSDGARVFRMVVRIDIYVADWNFMNRSGSMDVAEAFDNGGNEPTFVPASEASIEMLEKVNVEFSTTCSVCMEEIRIDSEATRMPCLHIFDEDCIVEWLHKSRFCPVCRFSMPADGDQ